MQNKELESALADKAAILNAALQVIESADGLQMQIALDALDAAYQDAIQRQQDADKD